MKSESHKPARHEQNKDGKVFGKGSYPLSPELKARIEAQRALEQKGKGKRARAAEPAAETPAPDERSLLPLVIATVVMVLLAAVMVLRVFIL